MGCARGMSIYQMALMGGAAAGAALWGQVANLSNVHTAVAGAAVFGLCMLALLRRWRVGDEKSEDLRPLISPF